MTMGNPPMGIQMGNVPATRKPSWWSYEWFTGTHAGNCMWFCLKMGIVYQNLVPSGNLLHCYWKWPFVVDLPIENGGSFHSYVSLPEGNFNWENDDKPFRGTPFSDTLIGGFVQKWLTDGSPTRRGDGANCVSEKSLDASSGLILAKTTTITMYGE